MESELSKSGLVQASTGRMVYEYLLVAMPDKAVAKRVDAEKRYFATHFGAKWVRESIPGISVVHFQARPEMEGTLLRWLHRIISNLPSFPVTLSHFSGIKPHTIYLRVSNHQPFQHLAKALQVIDQFVRSNGYPGMQTILNPHLAIASHLPPATYGQAVGAYAQKDFSASFLVNELVLLRRTNAYSVCEQVTFFGLRPSDTHND